MQSADLLSIAFKEIYEKIDKEKIVSHIDEKGLEDFINHCAYLSAVSGAVTGFGGVISMLAGIPADTTNTIIQQFRVSYAIIYARKGSFSIGFDDFIKIVGASVGIKVAANISKSVLTKIAQKILFRLSAKFAGKAIPVIGAAVGGTVNYTYIKSIAKAVDKVVLE